MRFSEFKKTVDNSLEENESGSDKKIRNLEMLLDVMSKVNQSLDPDEVLDLVVKNAIKLTEFDKGCIFLANPVTGKLEFKIGMDSAENAMEAETFTLSHTVIRDVFDSGQSIFIENALGNSDCRECKSILSLKLQTIFCSPLKNSRGKIGALYVDSTKLHKSIEKDIKEIFEIMVGQVTASIINAQLHNDLQKLSKVYTSGILLKMKGDKNRTASFLGIQRTKLDALLD